MHSFNLYTYQSVNKFPTLCQIVTLSVQKELLKVLVMGHSNEFHILISYIFKVSLSIILPSTSSSFKLSIFLTFLRLKYMTITIVYAVTACTLVYTWNERFWLHLQGRSWKDHFSSLNSHGVTTGRADILKTSGLKTHSSQFPFMCLYFLKCALHTLPI